MFGVPESYCKNYCVQKSKVDEANNGRWLIVTSNVMHGESAKPYAVKCLLNPNNLEIRSCLPITLIISVITVIYLARSQDFDFSISFRNELFA